LRALAAEPSAHAVANPKQPRQSGTGRRG
jgi:hypothetical protein